MDKKYISIQKTARYFTLGNTGPHIRNIWFVLHGYGQLAEYFLQKFKSLQNENTLVVAPEGLHRYYLNGGSGKIGASWMTKEERQSDIDDYVRFLDQVLMEIKKECTGKINIHILGFSQGAATAARWVGYGEVMPQRVIFWGGLFPPDMNWDLSTGKWKQIPVHVLIGDEDEFYRSDDFKNYYEPLKTRFENVVWTEYRGKHTIYEEVLQKLIPIA